MRRRLSSGFSGLQQPGAAGEGVGQQHEQHQQGSGSLVFEVDEGSDIDFDLPPIPHYGSAGGVQELRDVTNPGDSHRTVGRLYHDNTHKDLFPFDSEEELHFDELRDFRSPRSRKKLSARISVTFVQWLGVFCTCLAVSMLVFFLLALRADNLNKKFAHDNKSGAPRPTSSAPAGGAIESMLSPQAKHALQMRAAKHKLLQPADKKTKTYPAPPPRAIPLADSVKDEAKRTQEELKKKREKQAAADRAAVKTAPSTPSAKVNEMMKRRYEKLIQYISSAGSGSAAVTKNLPQLTHQPTVGGGRSLDPFNAPQPDLPLASAKSSESQTSQDVKQAANKAPVIDFGWRFDNPADVSKAFGSEMDHVLDLCRGRRAVVKHPNKTGQNDGDDGIKEEFVMYTLNSAAQYAYPCWQAFEKVMARPEFELEFVFLNELDPGEDVRHDLSFVRPSDKNKKWKTMRKKLKFGDFQSLYFMWPDGNAAPTAPGAEALPDGFPLPKGIAIKAGSTDQLEIMKGLAAMLDEVVGSDALVFITVQVGYENEQLANGATETVEVQTLVFYAMVGKNDIRPIAGYHQGLQHTAGDEKTGAEEKAYPPARRSGSGVWKVQTARDARGHEVCPGSMVQIFDTLAEMRHKIWPQLDIILILDASWSYASGEHQEDPFDNPHRNEWLKHSDMMRHLLTKLGDASLTPEQKLQIRAQILEGVKTPGRNCYLAPYLTGRPDYQQLTRMVGFTNHAITEWKGMQYPSMSVPGLFPGINYYIFELPEVVPPSPRTLPTTTTATTASTAPASAPEPFAYRGPHSANNWNVRVLNKKGQWADYLDADPEAVLNDSKNIPVVPDLNPRRPHRNIPNWVKQDALMNSLQSRQAGGLHEQSLDDYMNNRMTMDDVQRGGRTGARCDGALGRDKTWDLKRTTTGSAIWGKHGVVEAIQTMAIRMVPGTGMCWRKIHVPDNATATCFTMTTCY
eukprot:g2731.t1